MLILSSHLPFLILSDLFYSIFVLLPVYSGHILKYISAAVFFHGATALQHSYRLLAYHVGEHGSNPSKGRWIFQNPCSSKLYLKMKSHKKNHLHPDKTAWVEVIHTETTTTDGCGLLWKKKHLTFVSSLNSIWTTNMATVYWQQNVPQIQSIPYKSMGKCCLFHQLLKTKYRKHTAMKHITNKTVFLKLPLQLVNKHPFDEFLNDNSKGNRLTFFANQEWKNLLNMCRGKNTDL